MEKLSKSYKETKPMFTKPSTKLEELEDSFVHPNLELTNNGAKFLPVKTFNQFSSSSILNSINSPINNQKLNDNEQKLVSLQRSISEKLRNSFKNKSNLINIQNSNSFRLTSNSINYTVSKIEPRKWHSERCKKGTISKYSTQLPLNSHQKAILAQYAPVTIKKNQNIKIVKKFDDENDDEKSQSFNITKNNNNRKINTLESKAKLISLFKSHELSSNESDTESDDNIISNNSKTNNHKTFIKFNRQQHQLNYDSDDTDNENGFDLSDFILENAVRNSSNQAKLDRINRYIDDISSISDLSIEENLPNLTEYTEDNLYYEKVLNEKCDCEICLDECFVNERECCKFKACNNCINVYIVSKIKECCGNVRIECLNNKCNKLIHKDEITERLNKFDKDALNLYSKLLVDANKDPSAKTCPRCSHVMILNYSSRKNSFDIKKKTNKKKSKSICTNFISMTKCQCTECQLIWCFQCHAPWHDGITCSEFKKGDRMLKYWAKEVHYGQQNAQLCPKCNIYIQRTKGCDHMVCTFCQSEFCYKCGKKFRKFKFIGDHYSALSVLGCKYKLYPEKPGKRKFIRGSILGAKIAAVPLVAAVGLVVGAGVLAVSCVALPVYGSYKLVKHIKIKSHMKTRAKAVKRKLSDETNCTQKTYLRNLNDEIWLEKPALNDKNEERNLTELNIEERNEYSINNQISNLKI